MISDFRDLLRKIEQIPGSAVIIEAGKKEIEKIASGLEQIKDSDTYLSISTIAKELGDYQEYDIANKFLSKFVHTTSLSIHLRIADDAHTLLAPIFFHMGACYIDFVFPMLTDELKKQHC